MDRMQLLNGILKQVAVIGLLHIVMANFLQMHM